MSKAFGIGFAGVVAIIAVLIWFGFKTTKGNHLAPVGSIGKVRVQKVTDDVTFIVVDFNVRNDSDRDMVVHSIEGVIETPQGNVDGNSIAASDLTGAFRDYPMLGDAYNPVLKDRDIVPAHQNLDRMVALRFDVPVATVETRKRLLVRIEDATGPVLELTK